MSDVMRRNAEGAIVIDDARGVGMRHLHDTTDQHEADTEDAERRCPVESESGEGRAHASDSTITGVSGERQTGGRR